MSTLANVWLHHIPLSNKTKRSKGYFCEVAGHRHKMAAGEFRAAIAAGYIEPVATPDGAPSRVARPRGSYTGYLSNGSLFFMPIGAPIRTIWDTIARLAPNVSAETWNDFIERYRDGERQVYAEVTRSIIGWSGELPT